MWVSFCIKHSPPSFIKLGFSQIYYFSFACSDPSLHDSSMITPFNRSEEWLNLKHLPLGMWDWELITAMHCYGGGDTPHQREAESLPGNRTIQLSQWETRLAWENMIGFSEWSLGLALFDPFEKNGCLAHETAKQEEWKTKLVVRYSTPTQFHQMWREHKITIGLYITTYKSIGICNSSYFLPEWCLQWWNFLSPKIHKYN